MAAQFPIVVEGNLTTDPETGHTKDGDPWTRLRLAVDNSRPDGQGGWEQGEPEYHDVVVFRQQAENVAASLRKGDRAVAVGKLRFGTYEKDGKTFEDHSIVADTVTPSLRFTTVTIDPKATAPEPASSWDRSVDAPVAPPEPAASAAPTR